MPEAPLMPVDRLPTLTEVLELGREPGGASSQPALADLPAALAPQALVPDLVAQVLAALEPRLGALLETRLREALAPAVARAADGLIRDARAELAPALRSLVEETVAQTLRQPR